MRRAPLLWLGLLLALTLGGALAQTLGSATYFEPSPATQGACGYPPGWVPSWAGQVALSPHSVLVWVRQGRRQGCGDCSTAPLPASRRFRSTPLPNRRPLERCS